MVLRFGDGEERVGGFLRGGGRGMGGGVGAGQLVRFSSKRNKRSRRGRRGGGEDLIPFTDLSFLSPKRESDSEGI